MQQQGHKPMGRGLRQRWCRPAEGRARGQHLIQPHQIDAARRTDGGVSGDVQAAGDQLDLQLAFLCGDSLGWGR